MSNRIRRATKPVANYVSTRIVRWRTGTRDGQIAAFALLTVLVGVIFVVSFVYYNAMPMPAFLLPLIIGILVLRPIPQAWLSLVTFVVMLISVQHIGVTAPRISAAFIIGAASLILLYDSSLQRSGLPGPLGEAMLADLRDRLQSQGVVPALPEPWVVQSAMSSAGVANFAGDFLVADMSSDETHLEMILVDVCGKGVAAGTKSLQFAGALGGLIGALPPQALFAAANDFLLRQEWHEGFATAVHMIVNLETGGFSVLNAGHPPALQWMPETRGWELDGARGMALGVVERPEFKSTSGTIGEGGALMFYTDGVVESQSQDFSSGVEWLRRTATTVVDESFDHAPKRILRQVKDVQDDRAILILDRRA